MTITFSEDESTLAGPRSPSLSNFIMGDLDEFYDGVVTQDNRLRTQTYPHLLDFLHNPRTSCTSDNIDKIIDGLAGWVNSSNFKVCT